MTTNETQAPWFELLAETGQAVAHYIDDSTSEVFALRADAAHFVRVREDDVAIYLTLLTNNRAELIAGSVALTHMPDAVIAATIEAMLTDA